MKLTRKQKKVVEELTQRISDIAKASGVEWEEDDSSYWLCDSESLCRFLIGIQKCFNIKNESFALKHWNIDRYTGLDETVNFLLAEESVKEMYPDY